VTTFELLAAFDLFEGILANAKYLLGSIEGIVAIAQNVSNILDSTVALDNINDAPKAVSSAREQLVSVADLCRQKSSKQMFQEFASLVSSLDALVSNQAPNAALFGSFLAQIKELEVRYEAQIKTYAFPESLRLAQSATKVRNVLTGIKATIQFIRSSWVPKEAVPPEQDSLLLFLGSSVEAARLVEQLQAIQQLYSEICQLLNISEAQFPLRYLHLEVGSTGAVIAGARGAVGLLRTVLQRAFEYWYEAYTKQGKIVAITKDVTAIEGILKLRDELGSRGVDIKPLDAELSKATVKIASNLNVLLDGQERVQIDAEVYELPDEPAWARALLGERGKRIVLTSGTAAQIENRENEDEKGKKD